MGDYGIELVTMILQTSGDKLSLYPLKIYWQLVDNSLCKDTSHSATFYLTPRAGTEVLCAHAPS